MTSDFDEPTRLDSNRLTWDDVKAIGLRHRWAVLVFVFPGALSMLAGVYTRDAPVEGPLRALGVAVSVLFMLAQLFGLYVVSIGIARRLRVRWLTFWGLAALVPLLHVVVFFIMYSRAGSFLRRQGVKIGLVGARVPERPPKGWRPPSVPVREASPLARQLLRGAQVLVGGAVVVIYSLIGYGTWTGEMNLVDWDVDPADTRPVTQDPQTGGLGGAESRGRRFNSQPFLYYAPIPLAPLEEPGESFDPAEAYNRFDDELGDVMEDAQGVWMPTIEAIQALSEVETEALEQSTVPSDINTRKTQVGGLCQAAAVELQEIHQRLSEIEVADPGLLAMLKVANQEIADRVLFLKTFSRVMQYEVGRRPPSFADSVVVRDIGTKMSRSAEQYEAARAAYFEKHDLSLADE